MYYNKKNEIYICLNDIYSLKIKKTTLPHSMPEQAFRIKVPVVKNIRGLTRRQQEWEDKQCEDFAKAHALAQISQHPFHRPPHAKRCTKRYDKGRKYGKYGKGKGNRGSRGNNRRADVMCVLHLISDKSDSDE
jgi:hypothetical protein